MKTERDRNQSRIVIEGQTLGQKFDQFMSRALSYQPEQRLVLARERAQMIRRQMFRAPRDGRR